MSGNKIFVDTNILIYLLNGDSDISKILDGKDLVISVITELELKSFPKLTEKESKIIDCLIDECQVINMNEEIKKLAIEMRRMHKLKLPDAIVAASSFYAKLPIFTADKEFKKLDELNVIIFEV
ncbi:MAG: type II toxin-antitoxin system VapC family toxin [Cyclobacteriaceae bacterium]|nr:type II toxin-antitoxin system VapC family toxin [Cyclobacteriaceae bacterium]